MTATFYLFDVDHGQSAAMSLPNGRWCIFDVGCTATFSPVSWIAKRSRWATFLAGVGVNFKFLKATVSHLHGDHLADYTNLFQCLPEFLKTVDPDQQYIDDCFATCSDFWARRKVSDFVQVYRRNFTPATSRPDYGGVIISELSLPVNVARGIGGDANARVNNASVVTRIDVYGNSILLCGDMEKEAWDAIINDQGDYERLWRPFLSNIDILIAPHHGHRSGYSVDLMNLARPAVVLVSVVSSDPNVDTRYSQEPVRSVRINGTAYSYISTRQKGHIKVTIDPPTTLLGQGKRTWSFGDAAL